MGGVFGRYHLEPNINDEHSEFDIKGAETRLYPISGGLSQSGKINEILSEDEYMVVSGWNNCVPALDNFENDKNIRLLDILFCEGGCIMGPGISSSLSIEERRKKIIDYWGKI